MATLKCRKCHKEFRDYLSNNRKYCSRDCAYNSFAVNHKHECSECNNVFINKKNKSKFCSLSCSGKNAYRMVINHRGGGPSGSKHWNWQGGIHKNNYGYLSVSVNGKRQLLHRYIMEKFIGRSLKDDEHIHHKNLNKLDNDINNLQLVNPIEHGKLHGRLRYGNAC